MYFSINLLPWGVQRLIKYSLLFDLIFSIFLVSLKFVHVKFLTCKKVVLSWQMLSLYLYSKYNNNVVTFFNSLSWESAKTADNMLPHTSQQFLGFQCVLFLVPLFEPNNSRKELKMKTLQSRCIRKNTVGFQNFKVGYLKWCGYQGFTDKRFKMTF